MSEKRATQIREFLSSLPDHFVAADKDKKHDCIPRRCYLCSYADGKHLPVPRQPAAQSEGQWVSVPREPTENQLIAFGYAYLDGKWMDGINAMLRASSPTEGGA